jgi:uncharacterized protein (TIGR02271 family)
MRNERTNDEKNVDIRRTEKMESRVVTDREETIPVIQEDLEIGKREVETGGVRVQSRVTETPINEQVNLREEHVNIERHPVDRPLTAADRDAFQDRTIEMREHAEKAVVAKTARVVEQVSVGKTVTNKTEQISDSVRRTDVDIVPIKATTRVGYERYNDQLRSHYDKTFASSGTPFTHYDSAYRYGYELRGDNRLKGSDWSAVEPHARETWESHNRGTWDRFKDAIRHGFDLDRNS